MSVTCETTQVDLSNALKLEEVVLEPYSMMDLWSKMEPYGLASYQSGDGAYWKGRIGIKSRATEKYFAARLALQHTSAIFSSGVSSGANAGSIAFAMAIAASS